MERPSWLWALLCFVVAWKSNLFDPSQVAMSGSRALNERAAEWDYYLAGFAALAAYQRIRGLDHPTRLRIYKHVLTIPGDHFRSILRTLQLSVGVARHHLNVLVAHGLIRQDNTNGRARFYAASHSAEPEINKLYMRYWEVSQLRARILATVKRSNHTTPSDVARMMGISRQLAAYHLDQMVRSGAIKRMKTGYRF